MPSRLALLIALIGVDADALHTACGLAVWRLYTSH